MKKLHNIAALIDENTRSRDRRTVPTSDYVWEHIDVPIWVALSVQISDSITATTRMRVKDYEAGLCGKN